MDEPLPRRLDDLERLGQVRRGDEGEALREEEEEGDDVLKASLCCFGGRVVCV